MQPYKELTDRIEALPDNIPVFRIMAEAQVIHANFYNWQKQESTMLTRWFSLCLDVGIDPWKAKPGSSTYEVVKKRVLTRGAAWKKFEEHGYNVQSAKAWQRKGDPRQVEAFKRVAEVVLKYETQLKKAVPVL